VNSYAWDRANRLHSVVQGLDEYQYGYDGLGRRINQTVSSIVTEYFLDVQPGLPVMLGATANGETMRFLHTPYGVRGYQNDAGEWIWPVRDTLGSVRVELDDTLAVQASRQLSPIGLPFEEQGTFESPYAFNGEPMDGNGLVHLRRRYYNPMLGVFPTLDPLEGTVQRVMSLNRYMYAAGNPTNLVDPSGTIMETPRMWDACYMPHSLEEARCVFSQENFSVFDDSITNLITIVAFVEGRFAGPAGMALEIAAMINRLRYGNDLEGTVAGSFKTTSQQVCGGNVVAGCADSYVEGIMAGNIIREGPNAGRPIETYPLASDLYPGGNVSLMRSAYVQTKLQLLGHCAKQNLTYFYRIPGGLSSLVETLNTIYRDPSMRISLTFHADWYEELPCLVRCYRQRNPNFNIQAVKYGDEGVAVGNETGFLDYAVCSAQHPKSSSVNGVSCDYPICCREFTQAERDAADSPP